MRTLVLLPGMDGTGTLFAPLIAVLPSNFKVIVLKYPTSIPLGYDELIDLVNVQLPVDEDFLILGESFSGPVAVSLAALSRRNLRGLILCASFIRSPVRWPAVMSVLARILPIGTRISILMSVALLGRFGNSKTRRLLACALAAVNANVLRARIRSVLHVDVCKRAAAIRVPVLYLQASSDMIVPKSAASAIREVIPALRVVELEGPHMLLQVSPEAAARAIEAFRDLVKSDASFASHDE